jgi:transcriptional regulator with XRE-family HTH domain
VSSIESPVHLLRHVGARVREARLAQGLSQQALADRADVSRRMIAAIEGGESNVSLATLDRIAAALGMIFAELVYPPTVPRKVGAPVVAWRGEGTSHGTVLRSASAVRSVELWEWRLEPGDSYQAEPDRPGMKEIIYVIDGQLTVELEDARHMLGAGESVIFPSDQVYTYVNKGASVVRFLKNVVD